MIIQEQILPEDSLLLPNIINYKNDIYTYKDILFFDIETTGFIADNSMLYLIGCLYYKESNWYIIQWLSESYTEEKDLLELFTEFIQSKKLLIHFNGNTFDIPYLNKKYKSFGLENIIPKKESMDLYKEIYTLKKIISTENHKLSTLSKFIGFHRQDQYTGAELIKVYKKLIALKQLVQAKSSNAPILQSVEEKEYDSLKTTLLLHNYEDIYALKHLYHLTLLKFLSQFPSHIIDLNSINSEYYEDHIKITLPYKYKIPYTDTLQLPLTDYVNMPNNTLANFHVLFNFKEDSLSLRIPFLTAELKYFFSNYKDYYYLPLEGHAVHKSVAEYVDKDYRQKASKQTCFIKKHGVYLPLLLASYSRTTYKEKENYPVKSFFLNYEDHLFFYELNFFKNLSLGEQFHHIHQFIGHIFAYK